MVDIWVFVGSIRGRGLLEVESTTFTIIREVQRRQTRPKGIRHVVKARDSPTQIEMMDCVKQQ